MACLHQVAMQSPFFSPVLYFAGYEDLDFNKYAYFHGTSFDLTEIFEGNIFNPIEKKKTREVNSEPNKKENTCLSCI